MFKISDSELIDSVWHLQLKLLGSGIVDNYTGNRKAIKGYDFESAFRFASDIHYRERQKITNKLGQRQLLVRLRRLLANKTIVEHVPGCTFLIDVAQARHAFISAVNWWNAAGISTTPAPEPSNYQKLVTQCQEYLLVKYWQLDSSQLRDTQTEKALSQNIPGGHL